MVYHIDLVKYVIGVLRPSWCFHADNRIHKSNALLRFVCGLISPLIERVNAYNVVSRKMYAIASSDGTNISVGAYLDHYYGQGAGAGYIYVSAAGSSGEDMYPIGDTENSLNFFPKTPTSLAQKLYDFQANGTPSKVYVPSALQNTSTMIEIKADLDALTMLGFGYEIVYY